MSMIVYRLYTSADAVQNSSANLDIREDGVIVGFLLTGELEDNDASIAGYAELSFASDNSIDQNDSTAVIGSVRVATDFTTTATHPVSIENVCMPGLSIQVFSGERLYIHTVANVAPDRFRADAYLYVMPARARQSGPMATTRDARGRFRRISSGSSS